MANPGLDLMFAQVSDYTTAHGLVKDVELTRTLFENAACSRDGNKIRVAFRDDTFPQDKDDIMVVWKVNTADEPKEEVLKELIEIESSVPAEGVVVAMCRRA